MSNVKPNCSTIEYFFITSTSFLEESGEGSIKDSHYGCNLRRELHFPYRLAFSTRREYGISQTYILIIATPAIIWFISLNRSSVFNADPWVKRDTFRPKYTAKRDTDVRKEDGFALRRYFKSNSSCGIFKPARLEILCQQGRIWRFGFHKIFYFERAETVVKLIRYDKSHMSYF